MIRISLPLAVLSLAGFASAQNSILFSVSNSSNEVVLDGASGLEEARLIRGDEVGIVTPIPGINYSARCFLSMGAQWAFGGDLDFDANGSQVDSSSTGPGGDVDAIMVKRYLGSTSYGPRDIFYSYDQNAGSSYPMPAGFEDSDVVRWVSQGTLEFFVTEVMLVDACGQPSTYDFDVDAMCQTSTGDLFFSFSDSSKVVNGVTVADGGIIYIPSSAITYDANGNITAITTGSAVVVIDEIDIKAMIVNSGMKTSVGGDVITSATTSIDLSGLEIDPAGGTWTSPLDPLLTLPNLLFAWSDFSNDGAILSTAMNGMAAGSIPAINTVPLASTVATFGTQLGLLPDSTGLYGLDGLALIPAPTSPRPVAELHPVVIMTSSSIRWSQLQVTGVTPNSVVAAFVTAGPSGTPGNFHPAVSVPGFGGQIFGNLSPLLVLGAAFSDAAGDAVYTSVIPPIVGLGGIELVFQMYDLAATTFATPAPMKVL